ncbi:CIC11C00000002087 [Sungouiella intermedia]|uniref:Transcription initiation factor IIF subunit alpha n=1 Tax=Sungouiella intermedia TaxID=45354 RepID=A0A1L0C3Y3_9ASCO|nr:CIC11C00000002087 [[Candida] intermedia]
MSQPSVKKDPGIKPEPETGSPATSASPQMSPTPKSSAGGEWNVIPLKACSREELKDTRNHIMRFQTKQDVDIVKNFTKPVRLHRKDPQNIQFHLSREEMDKRRKEGGGISQTVTEPTYVDEEGNIIQPADMSQVAPDGGARRHRRNLFKRKTKQVHMMDEKKRKLRYEEYYPWVIEDYDGKNVYVGSYEAGLSESTHVLFVFDKDGFKMVPAEKVYKFTPRNRYATLTLEEAEAKMEKNQSAPRWLMKHMDEEGGDARFRNSGYSAPVRPLELSQSSTGSRYRMRTVQGGSSSNGRDSDHDDLDFEEEFADDEEAPIMDGDEEENKLSEKKIKKEMLKAATFEGQLDGDDSGDDLNDLFEVEKSRKVDKEGKKLKKVLNRTEGGVYDSDDNEQINPYVSQSDLESEEESESEFNVKTEPTDEVAGSDPLRPRSFFVSSAANGYIVIKAPKQFLRGFQPGEWNPQAKKRPQTFDTPSPKKTKRDEKSPSASPPPDNSAAGDLNNAGPNGELVTTWEVLDIVRNNPLTTKELLLKLKSRISTHKDNKLRIITIVKLNFRLVDGKLTLKEE